MTSFESINVYKVHPRVKIPHRAHETDAGIDFFFCPKEDIFLTIPPGTSALLETGIKMQVPQGCMLQIMNKSGIASKRSLITGACVVDEGYTGEIFVNLHNVGKQAQTIAPGQKIAQGVFVRIERPSLHQIEEDNIYGSKTPRGSGALGSTGDL
tara:strand:- start:69 stop:530 length:462 start_codon:yes stop_codon:yes gene_type:complete